MTQKIEQPTRTLGQSSKALPVVGLGCMGMSEFYGQADESRSIQTLHHALDIGVTHWDTADMYGPHRNEILLSKVLGERRQEVFLATKFGIVRGDNGSFKGVSGHPDYVRQSCEGSLKRLGVDHIDLYYQHRPDPSVPIADTIGAMSRLVEEGKVGAIGLSECSADTLRQAHSVHPISAYQGELSLWTRVHEGAGNVQEACAELGITFVAYSPLGRGFLTGSFEKPSDLSENDWRRTNPRFKDENFRKNLALVEVVKDVATQRGITAAQVALAWTITRPGNVITIPGTTKAHRVTENAKAASIALTAQELERLNALPQASGARYG